MRKTLEAQLAQFLRKQRGDKTYGEFAKRLGIQASTLHRLEMQQQSITLRTLQQILRRLNASLSEVFPDGIASKPKGADSPKSSGKPDKGEVA